MQVSRTNRSHLQKQLPQHFKCSSLAYCPVYQNLAPRRSIEDFGPVGNWCINGKDQCTAHPGIGPEDAGLSQARPWRHIICIHVIGLESSGGLINSSGLIRPEADPRVSIKTLDVKKRGLTTILAPGSQFLRRGAPAPNGFQHTRPSPVFHC